MMAEIKTGAPENTLHPSNAWRLFELLFVKTGRAMIAAPARWGWKGWAAFSMIVISTTIAFIEKGPIHFFFLGDDRGLPEFLAEIGHRFGDGDTVTALVVVLLALGFIFKRPVMVESGVVLAVAGVLCGVITLAGQFILAEARPVEGGAFAFFALNGHGISGHASSAAVLFWPLYAVMGRDLSKVKRAFIGAVLMSWAGLVAWSRMYDDKHYLWNVMLGVAVGFWVGRLAVREWREIGQTGDLQARRN